MSHADPEDRLRRYTAPHAATFGALLLARAEDDALRFDDFIGAARTFLQQEPVHAAEYLAALVALDMRRGCVEMPPPTPSNN